MSGDDEPNGSCLNSVLGLPAPVNRYLYRGLRGRPPLQRETTFRIGGVLVIALGVAFATALYLSGAGWSYLGAWFASGGCVGFGLFFLHVARDEARTRREFLASNEPSVARPPAPPSH